MATIRIPDEAVAALKTEVLRIHGKLRGVFAQEAGAALQAHAMRLAITGEGKS